MADKKILIVADSRGRELVTEVSNTFIHLDCEVIWKSGLSLLHTPGFAKNTILKLKPKLIYVLTGICDITEISSYEPWTVIMKNPDVHQTVYSYMTKLDLTHSQINSMKTTIGHQPMIIFPTQTGLSLGKYNGMREGLMHPQQYIMNDAINQINRNVTTLNASMNVSTPFLASSVHNRSRGKFRQTYRKLPDGCHPSRELVKTWASKLYENALINANKYDHFALVNHMFPGQN